MKFLLFPLESPGFLDPWKFPRKRLGASWDRETIPAHGMGWNLSSLPILGALPGLELPRFFGNFSPSSSNSISHQPLRHSLLDFPPPIHHVLLENSNWEWLGSCWIRCCVQPGIPVLLGKQIPLGAATGSVVPWRHFQRIKSFLMEKYPGNHHSLASTGNSWEYLKFKPVGLSMIPNPGAGGNSRGG